MTGESYPSKHLSINLMFASFVKILVRQLVHLIIMAVVSYHFDKRPMMDRTVVFRNQTNFSLRILQHCRKSVLESINYVVYILFHVHM